MGLFMSCRWEGLGTDCGGVETLDCFGDEKRPSTAGGLVVVLTRKEDFNEEGFDMINALAQCLRNDKDYECCLSYKL